MSCFMSRKLSFTYLFCRMRDTTRQQSTSSLSSPTTLFTRPASCSRHPRTHSFRGEEDPNWAAESCLSDSSSSADECCEIESFPSTASPSDAVEAVIRGLRYSDRLFFEPGGATSSIVDAAEVDGAVLLPFEGSIAMAMESEDPYRDFKLSMEEMLMAHGDGAKDWAWLEEMLGWYLRANGKGTHGIIVGAFLDLLVGNIAHSPPCSCSSCTSTTKIE